jgi:eukaryotic-like serine/threonine-protein kinase
VTGDRADRELLIESLAVHLGFLSRHTLVDLAEARRDDPSALGARPIGQLLVDGSVMTAEQFAFLETVVDGLMERHGGELGRCLDALSGFDRLRPDLERRRAQGGRPRTSEPGNPSTNPTLPSMPAAGGRNEAGLEPGPAARHDEDDSFLPGSVDIPPDEAPIDPYDEWSLGGTTSAGRRFRILRPHAQGGIGKVSVALDAELQREVALKQIKPERADDTDSRARFLQEAKVTGRLEHPGIVPVYGLGKDSKGRPFYAMRFVGGMSLDEAIGQFHRADTDPRRDPRERMRTLRHLLARFIDVCQTVAYAHSQGVLHRDLKPANVLLGPFNESLVVDWGLAKLLGRVPGDPAGAKPAAGSDPRRGTDGADDEQPDRPGPREDRLPSREDSDAAGAESGSVPPIGLTSSTETAAGTAFGTPAYMSPEQAEGRVDQLGPASDVYSLGAMLFTLLSGRAPFDFVWCDVTALLDRVRLGEFPPPRQVNARVPRALEAVCLKAMANRAEDRYGSATALAEEIERWLADDPVAAYREPAPARLARWGRRHKPIVAGAAALLITAVVALSAGVILIGREQHRTEQQRRLAEDRRMLAISKSDEATQKAEALRRRDAVSRVNLAYREYLDDNVALADELLEGDPADLRAWEWSYAHRLGHSDLKTWVGSSLGLDVWCVAFSPDGARVAAGTGPWGQPGGDRTGELLVRDIHTGATVLEARGLAGAVEAVAFAPDGRTIAAAHGFTGKENGSALILFDARTGRALWRAAERGVQILGLAFSPDGRTIATGCGHFNEYSASGYGRLRDAKTGGALGRPIAGAPGGVLGVAFAPDGRQIALASRDVVDLWDISGPVRSTAHQLRGHVNFVYAVAFSPDGRRVATGGWDKTIRIWDRETGRLLDTLIGHRGFVRGLAFSPDGNQLVSGSEDKSVRRWDLAGGGDNAAFHGHTGFVHCVAFGPDGALAASGSLDGTVKLWPAAAPDSQVTFRNSAGWVGTLAFATDARRIASAHNGNVRIWDPRTGEELHRIAARSGLLAHIGLAFSPDGTTLAADGPDGSLNLWDTASWSRRVPEAKSAPISDAAFSPDGSILATSGEDGAIRLWDVARGTAVRTMPGHSGGAKAVAFAPDGRRIASGGEDRTVRVWDATTGDQLAALTGHATGVQDLAFAPDGRRIASVGGTYHGPIPAEVKLWDWQTGQSVADFHGHTSLVTAVAYFPDGRRLATASDDRTVKLWDVQTREEVLTLRGHTSGVVSLAISRDGLQIASGSIDYTAKIWTIESTEGEAAFELSMRRAAVERVQALYAKHLLKSEVLDALQVDRTLSPRLRAAAMEVAGRRSENASGLFDAAWLTIGRPIGRPDDYRLALKRLEAACRVVADDPERLSEYRHKLALALYRAEQPDRALETLRDQAVSAAGQPPSPLDLAVTVMASHRLGRTHEARVALDQLRSLLKTDRWDHDEEALGFLHEAEGVMGLPTSGPAGDSSLRSTGLDRQFDGR